MTANPTPDDRMTPDALVKRLRTNVCPDNMGCGAQPMCSCDDAQDAADMIEALAARLAEVVAQRDSARHALVAKCTEVDVLQADCDALRKALAIARGYVADHVPYFETPERAKALKDLTTIDAALAARLAEVEAENFALAAGQCIVDGGLVGHENGSPICTLQADRDALRKALTDARPLVLKWCTYQGNSPYLFDRYLAPIDQALAAVTEKD